MFSLIVIMDLNIGSLIKNGVFLGPTFNVLAENLIWYKQINKSVKLIQNMPVVFVVNSMAIIQECLGD